MMNTNSTYKLENFDINNSEERAFAREELIYNVTEDLLVMLEDQEITKKELARRLSKSRSYVTQILSGSRNMTLGSFSDICFALGFKPEIKLPVQETNEVLIGKSTSITKEWVRHLKDIHIASEATYSSINVIDKRENLHWGKVA